MKHDEWIKHPAATTFLKQLRKGALRALFLACLIPLAFVFLVLLLGACVSFAVLLVLVLEAERVLHPDSAHGPDGIRAVLVNLIEEECGHEPAA